MMKAKVKNEDPYKFLVFTKKRIWESWTGCFESELDAMKWFSKHGKFHIVENNHILGLFKNRTLLKTFIE